MKRVLDVGNCSPDHAAIRDAIRSNFDALVDRADTAEEAVQMLAEQEYHLVLVNRIFDRNGGSGLELIALVRSDPRFGTIPVMLISNYDNYQRQAQELGAVPGFGKLAIESAGTLEKLLQYLGHAKFDATR